MMWRRMSIDDASRMADNWNKMTFEDFSDSMTNWIPSTKLTKELDDLIGDLKRLDSKSGMSTNYSNECYQTDLQFALGLYQILTDDYSMTPVDASDDDIWRFIQMVMIPDIIHSRWPGSGDKRINDDRQWKNPRRIWLKTLWFYIYLSWQGSLEETKVILSNNTSNDISQLIERSGSGYRLDLYREIMRQYANVNRRGSLDQILKLNVAYCGTVEPLLTGDIEKYVTTLFDNVGELE